MENKPFPFGCIFRSIIVHPVFHLFTVLSAPNTSFEKLFSKRLERKLDGMTDKLARMQTDLTEAVAAKGKPFEHAAELAEKSARLEQLNRELEVGKAKDVIMNDDDEQEHDAPAQTEEITKSAPKQKR